MSTCRICNKPIQNGSIGPVCARSGMKRSGLLQTDKKSESRLLLKTLTDPNTDLAEVYAKSDFEDGEAFTQVVEYFVKQETRAKNEEEKKALDRDKKKIDKAAHLDALEALTTKHNGDVELAKKELKLLEKNKVIAPVENTVPAPVIAPFRVNLSTDQFEEGKKELAAQLAQDQADLKAKDASVKLNLAIQAIRDKKELEKKLLDEKNEMLDKLEKAREEYLNKLLTQSGQSFAKFKKLGISYQEINNLDSSEVKRLLKSKSPLLSNDEIDALYVGASRFVQSSEQKKYETVSNKKREKVNAIFAQARSLGIPEHSIRHCSDNNDHAWLSAHIKKKLKPNKHALSPADAQRLAKMMNKTKKAIYLENAVSILKTPSFIIDSFAKTLIHYCKNPKMKMCRKNTDKIAKTLSKGRVKRQKDYDKMAKMNVDQLKKELLSRHRTYGMSKEDLVRILMKKSQNSKYM